MRCRDRWGLPYTCKGARPALAPARWKLPANIVVSAPCSVELATNNSFTVYRMAVSPRPAGANIYNIFGSRSGGAMLWPPAFQTATPFGSAVGGISPQFVQL